MPGDPVIPLPKAPRACPICGRPEATPHRPFCSQRCRYIDLGRWLNGNYRVPTDEPPDDDAGATGER